jgi:hypothetical protein
MDRRTGICGLRTGKESKMSRNKGVGRSEQKKKETKAGKPEAESIRKHEPEKDEQRRTARHDDGH